MEAAMSATARREATAAEALSRVQLPPGATVTTLERYARGWWVAWRLPDGTVHGRRVGDPGARGRSR
jgi:hypothetical protein